MIPAASGGAMNIAISGTASPPAPWPNRALGDPGEQDREHRDRIERGRIVRECHRRVRACRSGAGQRRLHAGVVALPCCDGRVGDDRAEHEGAADERAGARMLAQQRPDPHRPEDARGSAPAARASQARWPAVCARRRWQGGSRCRAARCPSTQGSRGRAASPPNGPDASQAGASVHRPAISTIGSMSTVAWNLRSTTSCAAKHTETPSASRLPTSWPASTALPNITTIPARANAIAIHVRAGTRSRSANHPASAASSGDTLISTNVLATVVRVSEPMKQKNVPESSRPASTPG